MKYETIIQLDGEDELKVQSNTIKGLCSKILETLDLRNDNLRRRNKSVACLLTPTFIHNNPDLIVLIKTAFHVVGFIEENMNYHWTIKEIIVDGELGSDKQRNIDIRKFLNIKS